MQYKKNKLCAYNCYFIHLFTNVHFYLLLLFTNVHFYLLLLFTNVHRYICDLITRREYKRELRTNDQMNLVPLVTRKYFGEHSFSYASPREWNKLKLSIKKSESLDFFKAAYK